MTSAEDAVRAQQKRKAAEEAAQERKIQSEVDRLWSILQKEAKLAIVRLEARGWPGGEMLTLSYKTPITNWRGKQTGTRQNNRELAAWKIIKLEDGDCLPDSFLYVGSDGVLYVNGYRDCTRAKQADIAHSREVGGNDPRTKVFWGPNYSSLVRPTLMQIVIEHLQALGR